MLEGGISTGQDPLRDGLAPDNAEEALLMLVCILLAVGFRKWIIATKCSWLRLNYHTLYRVGQPP